MGSLFPVEIARAVVMIVEHIVCPTFGGNELAMKGWMLSSLNGWSDDPTSSRAGGKILSRYRPSSRLPIVCLNIHLSFPGIPRINVANSHFCAPSWVSKGHRSWSTPQTTVHMNDMINLLIFLFPLFYYGRAQQTFYPPAIPLTVRSPYLSCWLPTLNESSFFQPTTDASSELVCRPCTRYNTKFDCASSS